MSVIGWIVGLLIVSILLFFLLRKTITPYPTGKVLCLQARINMYQIIFLDPVDQRIRIASNDLNAPIIVPINEKVYVRVANVPTLSILFLDNHLNLGIVTLTNLNGALKYSYAGTATEGSFFITVMDPTTPTTPTTSPTFPNLPRLVSNRLTTIDGLIPYSTDSLKGYQLPSTADTFPRQVGITSYNSYPIGILGYMTGGFTPFYEFTIPVPNQTTDPISLPVVKEGEYITFIAYNYTDGSLSASVLFNQGGKACLVYLFGGTSTDPDFVVSVSPQPALSMRQIGLIESWSKK
jgi:hypothetical protein